VACNFFEEKYNQNIAKIKFFQMFIEQQNKRETPYVGLPLTASSIFTLLVDILLK
jgi:hypothetical protein